MKLTPFFRELLEKRWSEFATMENDMTYTSSQAVIFSLVRACQRGKLPAIKEALNRIDGKIADKIEVEYPKFIFLFPYAKGVSLPAGGMTPADEDTEVLPAVVEEEEPVVTHSIRDTLERMSEEERSLVELILNAAKEVDVIVSYKGDLPESDPLVKSVIVAGLLKMAHSGNLGAIFEVLDQIDGKVADKIKVIGDDVYLNRYEEVAPYGAVKNQDGIYQLAADNTTSSWATALERNRKDSGRFNR